jgi:hypothetical protein
MSAHSVSDLRTGVTISVMRTGDVAIIVSVISLVLSIVSVGWNIYREVVLKPRVKVRVDSLVEVPLDSGGKVIVTPIGKLGVSAINFGPGEVKCEVAIVRFGSWWETRVRRSHSSRAVIARFDQKKLGVGERAQFTTRWQEAWFLNEANVRIGVVDSFGREHWAPQRQVRRRVKDYRAATAGTA